MDNQELSSREANYDSNMSNEDGVMVIWANNGSGGDSDGVVESEDAVRENAFLDASKDSGADERASSAAFTEARGCMDMDEKERLPAILDENISEKSIVKEYKDVMEITAKGIKNLRDQMRDMANQQLALGQSNSGSIHHFGRDAEQLPLEDMIHECSAFLGSFAEEIQDLNTKSTEALVSHEVINSYLSSAQNEAAEVQFQKDQCVEDAMNRMLSSLSSVVYVGDLPDSSVTGKIAHVEKCLFSFIENYNWFLYQSDQLSQCLREVRPHLSEQNDYRLIFAAANEELVGLKKNEAGLDEKVRHLEGENCKLIEELDKLKVISDTTNAEIERLKTELEQEKQRYSNTKEKLSLAVTKGKALFQQRESLKQSLADKTSEVEKYLSILKEKSGVLEAAELIKEELVKNQISFSLLQAMLAQRDLVFENAEDVMSQSSVPEGPKSKDVTERIRWISDDSSALKDFSMKYHQLADTLLSIDLPENLSFSDINSRLHWLMKTFAKAKTEIGVLQDEIGALQDEKVMIRETCRREMARLTALLSTALVEKDCLERELEDMGHKFGAIVQREHEASPEKQHCLTAMKEYTSSHRESFEVNEDILQTLQEVLYVKLHELGINEDLLEEETHNIKTAMDKLFHDLRGSFGEVAMLKEENDTLKKDLEQTEDIANSRQGKLTMAVKKGKTLVQERENLNQVIKEKNSEIEKLKIEVQQQELAISDYKSESAKLSALVQGNAKLEGDLLALKYQRDQLERNLSERNKKLDGFEDSINSFVLPSNSSFEDPIEKLRWIVAYLGECQAAKAHAEQQWEKAMLDIETLSMKVSEGESTVNSLEMRVSLLNDENNEAEIGRTNMEIELKKMKEVANNWDSKMQDAYSTIKSLEEALEKAKNEISELVHKNEASEREILTLSAKLNACMKELAGTCGSFPECRALLKASHLKILLDGAKRIQISGENSQVGELESQDSAEIKKLFYAIEKFPEFQHQIESLSHEKEELHTSLAAQLRETEQLKVKVQDSIILEQELAGVKKKVIDMEAGLDRIIQNFASINVNGDQKSVAMSDRVQVLELLVNMLILESKTFKSRGHKHESEVKKSVSNKQELAELKGQLLDLEAGVKKIVQHLGGDLIGDQKPVTASDLVKILEKQVMNIILESENMKLRAKELDVEFGENISNKQELAKVKSQLLDLETGLRRIVQKLRGDMALDQEGIAATDLIQILENKVMAAIMESENSKCKVHELDTKLLASQTAVDELLLKVKALEGSLQSRALPPETVKERKIFEAPSLPSASEISEIEDGGSSKPTMSPGPLSAHVRMMRKGSSDHIAVNVDSESSRLIDKEEAVADKGHFFKSLSMSGLVPKQGKMLADRIDGIWVSSDRLLRSRPGARLSLIAYCLFLHIWLLGAIL